MISVGAPVPLHCYGSTVASGPPYMIPFSALRGIGGAVSGSFMRKLEIYEKGINLEGALLNGGRQPGMNGKMADLRLDLVAYQKR